MPPLPELEREPLRLAPQGGGDHFRDHRCAGEWITIQLMKSAVGLPTSAMRYQVPEQDLRIDPARMPAVPRSRFVIHGVQGV